jgi:Putative MetA-pathway of phenol degradation
MSARAVAILLATGVCFHSTNVAAQSPADDPCGGPSALLSILDRPTVGDSSCVVPDKQVVLEFGAQRSSNRDGSHGFNVPEAEFRFGIPGNNELVLLPSNYTRQAGSGAVISGPGATVVGIKHELGYTANWLGAVESLVTLPSGNAFFGSAGAGVAVNGIVTYSPTSTTGLAMMLGVSSQTLSPHDGGGRYASVNPDFVATWSPRERVQLYAEVYGQSRTGPDQGSGWNADGGVQYLLTPSVEVDAEIGFRLAGLLGGFRNYVGLGLGVKY